MKIPVITTELIKATNRREGAQEHARHCLVPENKTRAAAELGTALEALNQVLTGLNGPIYDALKAVNGNAASFTLTTGGEIRAIAHTAEGRLSTSGISEKLRRGTVATFTPSGPRANAYKYATASTRITLLRGTAGRWFLTKVERVDVHPKQRERLTIKITPEAREAVIKHALAPFA